VVTVWSVALKKSVSDETRSLMRLVVESIAGHVVPMLSGMLAAKGYAGGPDDAGATAEWIAVAVANWLRSTAGSRVTITTRKGGDDDDDDTFRNPLYFGMLLLAVSGLALSSCASARKGLSGSNDWTVRACLELPLAKWLGDEEPRTDTNGHEGEAVVVAK
jgi:hypothetical protein